MYWIQNKQLKILKIEMDIRTATAIHDYLRYKGTHAEYSLLLSLMSIIWVVCLSLVPSVLTTLITITIAAPSPTWITHLQKHLNIQSIHLLTVEHNKMEQSYMIIRRLDKRHAHSLILSCTYFKQRKQMKLLHMYHGLCQIPKLNKRHSQLLTSKFLIKATVTVINCKLKRYWTFNYPSSW